MVRPAESHPLPSSGWSFDKRPSNGSRGFGAGVLAGCGFVAAVWGLSSLTTAQSLWVPNPAVVAHRAARVAPFAPNTVSRPHGGRVQMTGAAPSANNILPQLEEMGLDTQQVVQSVLDDRTVGTPQARVWWGATATVSAMAAFLYFRRFLGPDVPATYTMAAAAGDEEKGDNEAKGDTEADPVVEVVDPLALTTKAETQVCLYHVHPHHQCSKL